MYKRQVIEIAEALDSGIEAKYIGWIRGTCVRGTLSDADEETILLPSFEEIREEKRRYGDSFALQYRNNDAISGNRLMEPYGKEDRCVVQNPPQPPLEREELDQVYDCLLYTSSVCAGKRRGSP